MKIVTGRRVIAALLSAGVLGGCASGGTSGAPPKPQGSPSVQPSVVAEHAEQFADLGERPAGSQNELAAATYILGHLQTAGYAPLLDPVPVEDTVRSTNVVAVPPSGERPRIVVTVAYDTAPGAPGGGLSLGVWLELARALYAREQEHAVAFVALGAEHADIGDGNLGSRRLIEYLRGEDVTPFVVEMGDLAPDADAVVVRGSADEELVTLAESLDVTTRASPEQTDIGALLTRADLTHVEVSGGAEQVAEVLLEYLAVNGA